MSMHMHYPYFTESLPVLWCTNVSIRCQSTKVYRSPKTPTLLLPKSSRVIENRSWQSAAGSAPALPARCGATRRGSFGRAAAPRTPARATTASQDAIPLVVRRGHHNAPPCRNMMGYNQPNGYNKLFTQVRAHSVILYLLPSPSRSSALRNATTVFSFNVLSC